MKARIIGAILVILVLGGLYVLTEGDLTQNTNGDTITTVPATPSDNDFKNLKIN